jgi:hypothetical protein
MAVRCMSALGHKRTFRIAIDVSALPPKFGITNGMSAKGQKRTLQTSINGCENGHRSALMCPLRAKSYLQTDPKSSHGAWGKALSGIFK